MNRFTAEIVDRIFGELVTLDHAARLAGVDPATVRRAFDAGLIEGVRPAAVGKRLLWRDSAEAWAKGRAAKLAA